MTAVIISPTPRRDRNKAAIRARIVAAAIDLFAAHGIAAVTVEQIAAAADIGKGTIYNYFHAKEDIVVAFMADLEQRVQTKVSRLIQPKGSLESILTAYIRLQFRLKAPHHAFVRVFLGQMFLHTEQFFPYMVEMQKSIDPPLVALFTNLQARGLIRMDIKLPDLILIFKTIHLGLTALWAIEGPPFRMTGRTLKQEVALFCQGLKATA